ncbi:DUF3613 domain-containing protein [Variovorax sp. 375MFSha3.1]|uniref:DUF3613 domain-containing protein n=1 Tax=unclassified Variovorax TaxID=663243 RepID=UPI003AAC8E5E
MRREEKKQARAVATNGLAMLSAFGIAAVLMAFGPAVKAQQQAQPTPAKVQESKAPAAAGTAGPATPDPTPAQGQEGMDEEDYVIYEPLQVGDATHDLFAWQRGGEIASTTPRPIAGNVATRSYERYLKSFEFPIPERMSSTVKQTGSGSGSSSIPK